MNIRLSIIVAAVWLLSGATEVFAGPVSVREESRAMTTYPFSDPSPVVDPSRLYYPYTRFDGFTDKPIKKEWKTVVMENDYIRLTIFPEIGGKVWGAVDKTSGKEFIYENSVVKFRDIAMRGPWVSGGIEYNFGIIGHAPTSSAPVDYLIREKEDGSVSCYLSSFELIARTMWTVEVNLQPDKGYFTTRTVWYNGSSISQPYYQWMNAGYPVGNGAEFCYPGDLNIGHNGMASTFPTDSEGRDLSKYDNNMFGGTKSYHILGYYNDFYGIYWHGDDFGSVHCADFDDKLGMKIFLWGEDRAGGIWEELLTDSDGQYIELQSGRMFNQPSTMSARTPYRHFCSAPQQTDSWTEYWYPVKGIQGIDKAGKCGALNVSRQDGRLIISFSPAENFNTELRIYHDDSLAETVHLDAKVLEPVSFEVGYIPEGHMKIVLGDGMLTYSEKKADFDLERPYSVPERIDWDSAFGLYSQGKQSMYQKRWAEAGRYLEASLSKAPYLIPALVSLASLYQREGRYAEAAETAGKALALDTYCGEANYIYALANRAIGKNTEAKAAFSIAALSTSVRSAAYEQLGEMYAIDKDWKKAAHYAERSLRSNADNLLSKQLLMLAFRKSSRPDLAYAQAVTVLDSLPLQHFARFEKAILERKGMEEFMSLIRNEMPYETCMEIAGWYESIGCYDEAIMLYGCAGNHPIALYRKAYLQHLTGDEVASHRTLDEAGTESAEFVFPFRPESLRALEWAASETGDWKPLYYQGLIHIACCRTDEARKLLDRCNPENFAAFYLTRAKLKYGEDRLEDLLGAERAGMSWRTGLALSEHYAATGDWANAAAVGEKYHKAYPDNYNIALSYAKALCESGKYEECIALLDTTTVLPYEGSSAGHKIYRTAHLCQAIGFLKQKNFAAASDAVKAAELWPEHLGSGKPYPDRIDLRLENYLKALIYSGQGRTRKAMEMYRTVADHSSAQSGFSSSDLLVAMSLREIGKKEEADRMVAEWSSKYPDDAFTTWCVGIYNGKSVRLTTDREENHKDDAPWESSVRDTDRQLIIRLFSF